MGGLAGHAQRITTVDIFALYTTVLLFPFFNLKTTNEATMKFPTVSTIFRKLFLNG